MGRQILIIDDDPDDQNLFKDAIHEIDESIQCTFLTNGLEALDLFDGDNPPIPDFIFLDLNMPIVDGKECLEGLKNKTFLHSVPIIIFTTSNQQKDVADTEKLGADRFITKPARFSEWLSMIKLLLFSK